MARRLGSKASQPAGEGVAKKSTTVVGADWLHRVGKVRLTIGISGMVLRFPPHRSGSVRSAKRTGDDYMLAVWRRTAIKRTNLPLL